jgi:hypothetical protein
MKILSLGWGVQSFTLSAMAALGEIEPVDFAVHADTLHESALTYDFAKRWTPWLEERGVKVVTVRNKTDNPVPDGRIVDVPAYTIGKNGKGGKIQRHCTGDWKIAPQRRWFQANRNGKPVELLLGISLDEFQRMKDSDVKYVTNRWPLIEMKMTRADCIDWLNKHDLEIPAKSACVFCPFHSSLEWRLIKEIPEDWNNAVAVDRAIRRARLPYELFLHPLKKPLEEVDFRTAEEKGQLSLWDDECSGICGV